ncbi:hypothetical protein CTEN210_00405 [Chaetoceros tenuissimus]|uniref:Methyltransferase domain-containing protein n=1 Tax=Chaetoceros tenuissimus TaxID=426638 RepID=A0AAD3CDS5_9STRA|nr:hypothetical protein CTEN210_00405 [Chaetoceros tenuissimus]
MTSSTSLHPIQNTNKEENLIVTLQTWLQHETKLPLIDLRSHTEYQTKRLKVNERIIVHLPFEDLQSGERSCELPPRNVQFAILIPSHTNMDLVHELFFGRKSKATQQSRKPWFVLQILIENESLWSDAEALNLVCKEALDPLCQARLWKPDGMVENTLLPLLQDKFKSESCESFTIWDLGSGAGRDVCFLAEELKHISTNMSKNFTIVGFDNHKGSAARSNPFWKNRGVADVTASKLLNLQHVHLLHDAIQEEKNLVCLYAVRFLNRTMLRFIASCTNIKGIFAMSHFCKETKDSEWNFEHPNVKHVLERNELEELFSAENGWETLHDSICMDGDHGRTLIHFCARKM